VHTGEVTERDGDYFGTPVNQAARLMAVGHGGQVLVSAVTASLVGGEAELIDLGEHRLRDLSGATRVFQLGGDGLRVEFPPLRTLDAAPGNLPVLSTSLVGRDAEIAELAGLVRSHRLVTLTGVGGVGKTRLAVQVAAGLIGDFPDGVWVVELAPVSDPGAVADAAATVFGITPQAGSKVVEAVARALSGRRILLVLDNCEHVLDAAAELADAIVARTTTVTVMATSREGLRVGAERLWAVPSLSVADGAGSAAVELFVERARAVASGFTVGSDDDAAAVTEICRRLDGIPLAIELAAARMVSMTPRDVSDRLDDRFRILSGSRRAVERHQTLRQAVQWSYELLDVDERAVLVRSSVFAGGFDLAAAVEVCGDDDLDEFALLDRLDALVRKSLVTVEGMGGHARYGMLETIRQFAEEQLAASGASVATRDGHARFFADQAVAYWGIWDGPRQRVALDWVDAEFANLRAGFRWAADQADPSTAAAIAAHTTLMAMPLARFEPAGWCEEILEAATTADLAQLPRVLTGASLCSFTGRAEAGVAYAEAAAASGADPRYEPFDRGWARWTEASAHLFAGRMDRWLEICSDLAGQPGLAHVLGLDGLLAGLPAAGRSHEAMAIADETVAAARAHGNPCLINIAMTGYGRAFIHADPVRALSVLREALVYAEEHRLRLGEATVAREAAGLEAVHGDLTVALAMFDAAIDGFHRAGNVASLAETLANVAVFFDRVGQPETAATVYGASANHASIHTVITLPKALEHLRAVLGTTAFDNCAAAGAAMEVSDAVRYTRRQIQLASQQPEDPTGPRA